MKPKKLQLEAELMSVLAQPTRLKILYFLKDGEKCACKINPFMELDSSIISRHLVKMRDAGILASRKDGVSIYYRIKEHRVFQILEIVDDILQSVIQEKTRELVEIF